jgi:FkbM family methyltransferase
MINTLKKIKYFLEGRIIQEPQIVINKKWIGNQYGGFNIHPNNLNKNAIVYSLGIGTDVSFDEELISEFGCKVYAYDPTPKSIYWVAQNVKQDNFIMHPFGISNKTEKLKFYLPKNDDHVSGSLKMIKTVNHSKTIELDFKSIKEVMKQNKHDKIHLLKLDIEAAEYDLLNHIIKEQIQIDQIVVEFHPHLIDKGKKETLNIMKKMNEYGFKCFAISKTYLEYSFIKV